MDLVPDHEAQTLMVERGLERLPRALRRLFDRDGRLAGGYLPDMALELWKANPLPELRVSQEVGEWLECRRRESEAVALRRTYEQKVQSGQWPAQETLLPLFPYQREGMLHLACAERALLADELGLGKTIQAVAAAAPLAAAGAGGAGAGGDACVAARRMGRRDCPLHAPASADADRAARRAAGGVHARGGPRFFTITAYESILADSLEINERLQPEVVILDEAQRVKNWNTKTAMATKRLRSRYAWVLTGTPIESHMTSFTRW